MERKDLEPYKDVEVEFLSLYKGCFAYEGEHEGKKIIVCGGRADYESAYNLKLEKKCKLSVLVIPEYFDMEIEGDTINFSEKPDY